MASGFDSFIEVRALTYPRWGWRHAKTCCIQCSSSEKGNCAVVRIKKTVGSWTVTDLAPLDGLVMVERG